MNRIPPLKSPIRYRKHFYMKNKIKMNVKATVLCLLSVVCSLISCDNEVEKKSSVDYVNHYMGNISHLPAPANPTVHLPNGMLRVYPERSDYASGQLNGLPLMVAGNQRSSSFSISPVSGLSSRLEALKKYSYDNEKICPYRYSVYLDEDKIQVDFAPSYQSGIYNFSFEEGNLNQLIISAGNGKLEYTGAGVAGYQMINGGPTIVFMYMEAEQPVKNAGALKARVINYSRNVVDGKDEAMVLDFSSKQINIRYGISFISVEQARKNLKRDLSTYSVDIVAEKGRKIWNEALGKIQVNGGNENNKTVFYTSLYRIYERMVSLSEDGQYCNGTDNQVYSEEESPFRTDDRIWDTYRAAYPLFGLIAPEIEADMRKSNIRKPRRTDEGCMHTLPEVADDSLLMNGNNAYLYNSAGQPWKTQKCIRSLLKQWFREDMMGITSDEDCNGLSAFVVFSSMGFYPVTPGSQVYNIGSPLFQNVKINLGNGKFFEIEAQNCSDDNKYIQSATLNGVEWNKPWFNHEDIANGGKLVLVMGDIANKSWGASLENAPPSSEKM